ncbi:hypothetical protein [Dactylosporangium sp. NPDC050588]
MLAVGTRGGTATRRGGQLGGLVSGLVSVVAWRLGGMDRSAVW